MGGPFLVPVREGAISHLEGVHELRGKQGLVNGDKVGFEGSAEICPGAKVWGREGEGCALFIFSPFASSGSKFEVSKGCGDVSTFICKDVLIKVVVVFKGCPEGIGFGRCSIEWFRGSSHCLCVGSGSRSRHGWNGFRDWGCGLLYGGFRAGGETDLGGGWWVWVGQ